MSERVVLVTGATDGLGKAVAIELARAGDAVLIHGRGEERLEATANDIRNLTGNDRLRSYRADFASLADVRSLAEQILEGEDRLDVVVNNAGIGTTLLGDGERRLVSDDRFELRFAVNYLAHFLLTGLLKELVVASAPA